MLWPTSARHERLPARTPDVFDQALPSSTSLAVRALHSLAVHTKNPAYRVAAHRAATAALPRAARYPAGCAALLLAAFELERDKPASGASLDLRPAFAAAKRGARVRIQVNLDLPGGWHLQRDDQGHLYRLQLKGDATVVSQGDDHFVIRLAEDASGDVIPVEVSLTITACNDTSCLPPETFNRSLWFDPRADEPGMEPFDRPS